jgi:hypothetical protein
MKQPISAYTSVGIEASYFVDNMYEDVPQELFKLTLYILNETVISQNASRVII